MNKVINPEIKAEESAKNKSVEKKYILGEGWRELLRSAYKPDCIFLKEITNYSFEDKKITGEFKVSQLYTNIEVDYVGAEQDIRCTNQLFASFFYLLFNDWFEKNKYEMKFGEKEFENFVETNGFLDAKHNTRYKMAKKNELFEISMEITTLRILSDLLVCEVNVKGPIIGKIMYTSPLTNNPNRKFLELMEKELYTNKVSKK